ncbi:MAG: hypothetical protein IPK35_22530 [Saprospiraceae bacterium]|jgi:hypothetical protein|nr:hypothetical protein [Saprospiraceae bacterium]
MSFVEEIKGRSNSDSLDSIMQTVWENYGEFLFGSNINSIQELTDFQAGFLHLMDEKWTELIPVLIEDQVKPEFDNWYEEENSYEQINLQSIDISNIEDGSWQLMFEDDNVDLIVHLYMKEWEFQNVARTG